MGRTRRRRYEDAPVRDQASCEEPRPPDQAHVTHSPREDRASDARRSRRQARNRLAIVAPRALSLMLARERWGQEVVEVGVVAALDRRHRGLRLCSLRDLGGVVLDPRREPVFLPAHLGIAVQLPHEPLRDLLTPGERGGFILGDDEDRAALFGVVAGLLIALSGLRALEAEAVEERLL